MEKIRRLRAFPIVTLCAVSFGVGGYVFAGPLLHMENQTVDRDVQLEARGRFSKDRKTQISMAIEKRGIFLAGSNEFGIVDPTLKRSKDEKQLQWPKVFAGQLFRDVSLAKKHAAAVNSSGDLVQWGDLVISDLHEPQVTIKGKDFVQVCCTSNSVFALTRSGAVFVQNVSSEKAPLLCLELNAKADFIATGDNHALIKGARGELFSVASNSSGNAHGQLGLGFSEESTEPFVVKKVDGLQNQPILSVACGDNHSLALSKDNRCYGFGQNTFGQLAQGFTSTSTCDKIERATEIVQLDPLRQTSAIYAGGNVSAFSQRSDNDGVNLLTCGNGLYGQLGSGAFSHVSPNLSLVKEISGKVQYSEAAKGLQPIDVMHVSIGATHAAAILRTGNAKWGTGNDLYVWGNNQFGQLLSKLKAGNNATPFVAAPILNEEEELANRLSLAPETKFAPENVYAEQSVACGVNNTALYFKIKNVEPKSWFNIFKSK